MFLLHSLPSRTWVARISVPRASKERAQMDSSRRSLLVATGLSVLAGKPLLVLAEPEDELKELELPKQKKTKKQQFSKSKSEAKEEERLLKQNERMQLLNKAPPDFPKFVREGFKVKVVVTSGNYVTSPSGLIYLDLVEGDGETPKDGQEVVFNYVGYNETGRKIDSTYQQGRPARTRLGDKGLVPGFEEGLRSMKPGGLRRIVVPPELGPPVGPSTFFSSKQFEVFDVELVQVKNCVRRTIGFFSDFVCE